MRLGMEVAADSRSETVASLAAAAREDEARFLPAEA